MQELLQRPDVQFTIAAALTAGGAAGGVALTGLYNSMQIKNEQRQAQKDYAENAYTPYKLYHTFCVFQPGSIDCNGTKGVRLFTDPRWLDNGPQVDLPEIFTSHKGASLIMNYFEHAHAKREEYDTTLTFQTLQKILPKEEFQTFLDTIKKNWDIHCRTFIQRESAHIRELYQMVNKEPPDEFYACLFYGSDGQGRILFMGSDMVQAGVKALPAPEEVIVLHSDGRYYHNETFRAEHGQSAEKMKRYWVMRDIIEELQCKKLQNMLRIPYEGYQPVNTLALQKT